MLEKYSEDQCIIKSKSPPQENAILYEPKTQTIDDQVYNTTIRYYSFNKFDYCKVQLLYTFIFLIHFSNDPALWEINDRTKDYISIHGFTQNVEKLNFSKSKRRYQRIVRGKFQDYFRYCTSSLFYSVLSNEEEVKRHFLLYSESTGKLYCVPCRLFNGVSSFSTHGFSDWKKAGVKLSSHENSNHH